MYLRKQKREKEKERERERRTLVVLTTDGHTTFYTSSSSPGIETLLDEFVFFSQPKMSGQYDDYAFS